MLKYLLHIKIFLCDFYGFSRFSIIFDKTGVIISAVLLKNFSLMPIKNLRNHEF